MTIPQHNTTAIQPADTDTTDLEAKIIEYGFNIVDYDDAADA